MPTQFRRRLLRIRSLPTLPRASALRRAFSFLPSLVGHRVLCQHFAVLLIYSSVIRITGELVVAGTIAPVAARSNENRGYRYSVSIPEGFLNRLPSAHGLSSPGVSTLQGASRPEVILRLQCKPLQVFEGMTASWADGYPIHSFYRTAYDCRHFKRQRSQKWRGSNPAYQSGYLSDSSPQTPRNPARLYRNGFTFSRPRGFLSVPCLPSPKTPVFRTEILRTHFSYREILMPRRPQDFNSFVGHPNAVRLLKRQIKGAQRLGGRPCPHILITGGPGRGKSHLARATAVEYGTTMYELHGRIDPDELVATLASLQHGDFLFVDEAHCLRSKPQEYLSELIVNGTLKCKGPNRNGQESIDCSPCSLILATDQPEALHDALFNRFDVRIHLDLYDIESLREIAFRIAVQQGIQITPQAVTKIARLARGLPRCTEQLVCNVWRDATANIADKIGVDDVARYQRFARIDDLGLHAHDRAYLKTLEQRSPLGLDTIATVLRLSRRFLATHVEHWLLECKLIEITRLGREITKYGSDWYRKTRAMDQPNSNSEDLDDHC